MLAAYCTCGAGIQVSSTPAEKAAGIVDAFRESHYTPGHEPCDATTARRARAKEQRQRMAEHRKALGR